MSEASVREIFDMYVEITSQARPDREWVHWKRNFRFRGNPGHYYFVDPNRRPSHADLARITRLSGHPEVVHLQANAAHFVFIGNRHFATAQPRILAPDPEAGVVYFGPRR